MQSKVIIIYTISYDDYSSWTQLILKYAKDNNFGRDKRLKLSDIFNSDVSAYDYHRIRYELALCGYIFKLIEGGSKYKVFIDSGESRGYYYSYFELQKSSLFIKCEELEKELQNIKSDNLDKIHNLNSQIELLRERKNAGPKTKYSDELIRLIYVKYLEIKSLSGVAVYLEKNKYLTYKGNTKWGRMTLLGILSNRFFVTNSVITKTQFNEVQNLLRCNKYNRKEIED